MVDVVSTRLQEVYAKWEARTNVDRNGDDNTPRLSLDGKIYNSFLISFFTLLSLLYFF